MRRIVSMSATAVLLVLCSACATTGEYEYKPNAYRATLDTERIAAVESHANAAGTKVFWLHPPRKSKKAPK
jgi:hypothetical protein